MSPPPEDPTDPQRPTIDRILRSARRIAVVGWSDDPDRASHQVAEYLSREGYEVLPVNPRLAGTAALGTTVAATLAGVPGTIDAVDIFRKSDQAPEAVREAIARGVRMVWMQEGVVSEDARDVARSAGADVVMDRCMMKEHLRLSRQAKR